jgi:HEPN domain-containing protein
MKWKTRKNQGGKFADWSQALLSSGKTEGAFYLAHMSAELVIKSAIARHNKGWHPTDGESHNLVKLLSNTKTQFIVVDMANDQNTNIHKNFFLLHNTNKAWKMHYRYEDIPLSESDMAQGIGIYTEVFEWIQSTYLK